MLFPTIQVDTSKLVYYYHIDWSMDLSRLSAFGQMLRGIEPVTCEKKRRPLRCDVRVTPYCWWGSWQRTGSDDSLVTTRVDHNTIVYRHRSCYMLTSLYCYQSIIHIQYYSVPVPAMSHDAIVLLPAHYAHSVIHLVDQSEGRLWSPKCWNGFSQSHLMCEGFNGGCSFRCVSQ